jgi:hypothetical protein
MLLLHLKGKRIRSMYLYLRNVCLHVMYMSILFFFKLRSRSSLAPRSVRFGVLSRKLSNVGESLDG